MSVRIAVGLALLSSLAISACSKRTEAPPAEASAEASAAAAPAPAAPAADAAVQDEEAAAKKKAIERALAEETIVSDAKGQWATSATASSTYAGDKDPASTVSYAPMQVVGKPDVERYGDDGRSWAAAQADAGIEWLQVEFAKPVSATELRVRQSYAPGAIIKLELIDEAGSRHTVWEGVDDARYDPSTVEWFKRSFAATAYKAKAARITLATNAIQGWNEIDAVQLIGE